MSEQTGSRHIGRKIWYSIAIVLSVLVLLLSAAGVIGAWVVGRSLSNMTVSLLGVVEDTAGGLRQLTQQIDTGAAGIQEISTDVAGVSAKISQNVEDKGLVVLLLPAEQEQRLAAKGESIHETFSAIRNLLASGINFYNSIDSMPFISLPKPDPEKVSKIQKSVEDTRANVAQLRQNVQDFRSGAAGKIDLVTQAADKITQGMGELRNTLAELDSDLAALQELAIRLQMLVPLVFVLVALLVTLFLAYVIYSQVEVMRLFVQRWRLLGATPPVAPLPETPVSL